MKYLSIFFILLFISFGSLSQEQHRQLKEKEIILNQLLTELRSTKGDEELQKMNNQFKEELQKTLEIEGSFDYPFSSLKTIGKIYSQDKLVRVFSWNIQYKDLQNDYFSFIQKKDERKNQVTLIELIQEKQNLYLLQDETLEAENWYGALYYDIIDVERRNRTYYTLLGYDANSRQSTIKLIDVLYFSGKTPRFGYPLFETKRGKAKRVIFEYSAEAVMSLKYDKEREKIIFDHLSPESSAMKDFREFYVPDMSYDAYSWDGKQWNLLEDIIAVNDPTPKTLELKVYDSKLDSVVTVSDKNKWNNPEDAKSPIDGGRHQAVTPDDVKKSKKGSKKEKAKKTHKNKEPKSSYKGIISPKKKKMK